MKDIFQGVKNLALINRSLDLRAQKHLQVVSNISNSFDPNYQAFEMVLDGALKDFEPDGSGVAMKITHERHLTPGNQASQAVEYRPQVTVLEEEMARLTENHIMYNASVDLFNRQIRLIRLAVTDRT